MPLTPNTIEIVGAVLFAVAVIHTFSVKSFEHIAHHRPQHAGVWRLLGEVEIVFGFWATVLVLFLLVAEGKAAAVDYLDSRNFTEPLFVFAIMVVAGSKPVLMLAGKCVHALARFTPLPKQMSFYFVALAFVPILGSFITEPAAMTLAALILRDRFFSAGISNNLKYATLGVLLVNISIGGTLTPFAAPPILMVAGKWGWDIWFMIATFGWKAAVAVVVNALSVTLLFRRELSKVSDGHTGAAEPIPLFVTAVHVTLLAGIVVFSHHPPAFMGLFLFFLGFATAYKQYQNGLILREGLLVAFFLAGLVVLGGLQQWWLEPLLSGMSATTVYFGATILTSVTDNAALTYLGSLVDNTTDEFKYSLVAGAVTGGGLTVIANAPNPAGFAILRGHFDDEAISPVGLLIAALAPTVVAVLAFRLL